MERCPNCGATIRPGAKFCTTCGLRLPDAAPAGSGDATARSPFDSTSTVASRWPSSEQSRPEPPPTEREPEGADQASDALDRWRPETPGTAWPPAWSAEQPAVAASESSPDATVEPAAESAPAESLDDQATAEVAPDAAAEELAAAVEAMTQETEQPEPEPEPRDADRMLDERMVVPAGTEVESWRTAPEPESAAAEEPAVASWSDAPLAGVGRFESAGRDSVEAADRVPPEASVDRAMALLDELRAMLPGLAAGPGRDVSEIVRDLESARSDLGDAAASSSLREVVETARERPRDIDAILGLIGRLDDLVSLLEARERSIAAIDRALERLRPAPPAE